MDRMSIAVDGPAGSGKSTVAKLISKELGILYLDTGAMYRAVALKAIRKGINTRDKQRLYELMQNIDIRISYSGSEQLVYLDGEEVSRLIRTPEVSRGASDVSAVPEVRIKLVELQREIADQHDVVMDGRDIGTYVLPDARVKVFLTASIEERARRRHKEQLEKGATGLTLEEVRKDIEYRDRNDSTRDFAPLAKAADAVEIDTTGMTVQEVAQRIISLTAGVK